jgi:hypothetical protein
LPAKNDFCNAHTHVQPRAAGVSPPWAWVTHLQGRYRKRAGDRDRCVGKYPCSCDFATLQETTDTVRASVFAITAAGGASVVLRAIARWHCECACANPRGANAPRSCIALRTSVGEKRFLRCTSATSGSRAAGVSPPWLGHTIGVSREANVVQRRANTQPGAAGVSPPWAWVTHLQRRFCKVAGDCRRCAYERQRIRVERCRKGPTLVPAPTLRDFQSLSSRAGFPRGANAPRSCIAARTLVGEKTIFAMHKRTLAQERRA